MFVHSSKIPQLIRFAERQTIERHIDPELYRQAYSDLKKSAQDITTISVKVVRDPEARQYALEILKLLIESGVRVIDDERKKQKTPHIIDTVSPDERLVVIYPEDTVDASQNAAILRDAFLKAEIETLIGPDLQDDYPYSVIVRVGYK